MSFGDESRNDLATARGRDWPSVRQFNIFLANRVGALVSLIRCFEDSDVHIVSLTVIDTADCAIVRIVLNDPERGTEILQRSKLMFTESDLLVVQLPEGNQPLLRIAKTLLAAELNVHYAYPILVGPQGYASLAIHVDDHELAAQTLTDRGFTLFTECDLADPGAF